METVQVTADPNHTPDPVPAHAESVEDTTGRDRMAWNVAASWAGHMVFVVSGFILPRLMDRYIGQTALGVWDFGWSLVSYFSIAQAGIGSSVNHYVAKHRAAADTDSMNRAVSTVMCIQFVGACIVVVLTIPALWAVEAVWSSRLGEYTQDARWVVLLLGGSLAVQMAFDAFNGVITGCHRWDLHNGINAGFHCATVAGMIVTLSLGSGLRGLALMYLCGVIATEVTRALLAHRVCPGLRIRLRAASWMEARQILGFGGKTLIHAVGRLLLYQTNSLILASCLGPAALAAYARPGALVRHANTLVNKFAFVLTPSASSLHAAGHHGILRDLLIQATRFAAYITLPMVLMLTILGDSILAVWMGASYQQGAVLAILAVGHLAPMVEQPAIMILAGMNAHGRPGLANFVAAMVAVGLGVLTVGHLQWGLIGASLSIALPLAAVNGIYVPIHACRQLNMSLGTYAIHSLRGPVLCAVPFAAVLTVSRLAYDGQPKHALLWGSAAGFAVLAPLYWRCVMPLSLKQKLVSRLLWPLCRRPILMENPR